MSAAPTTPTRNRSRAASPLPRGPACAAMALAVLLPLGCGGESSSAQEAVVPSDRSTVVQRARAARVRGDSAAPVKLFEVADFQCSYCAQFYRETYPAIDSLYVETGKVQYFFITYPNASHARAWPAVEAAYCAGAAGKFWQMHDVLFERQSDWTQADDLTGVFTSYAEELGIDSGSYAACLENDRTAPLQVRDLEQIARAGISSTPFFIINNEVSLQGAAPLQRFRTVLDSVLNAVQGVSGGSAAGGNGGSGAQSGG